MNADTLIVVLIATTSIAMVLSKTHVAFVTLALTAGALLADTVAADLASLLGITISGDSFPVFSIISIVLLTFPPFIIGYRFRRSQKGGLRFFQQIVPAVALALLGSLLIFDALPDETKTFLEGESYLYDQLSILRVWLVLFAIMTALFDVLIQHAGPPRHYKKRKGKKKKEE